MKGQPPAVVAAAALGMLLVSVASADEKEEKAEKDRDVDAQKMCVDLNRLRSTTVIDDHTILFKMRNGDILLNYLPQACPELGREKRFSYRVTANRLCDIDSITVLQDFGLGLGPGATCQLGAFNPITKEAAADLEAGPRKSRITAEQVEPIKTDDAADGKADQQAGSNDAAASGNQDAAASGNEDAEANAGDVTSSAESGSSADDESSTKDDKKRRSRKRDR